MRNRKLVFLAVSLVVLGALAGCGSKEETSASAGKAEDTPADSAPAATGTASVTGKMMFEGTAPAMAPMAMGADPVCMQSHTMPMLDDSVKVADGMLENVFVYLKDIQGSFPVPATKHGLDQKGCQYSPHVSGMMAGQTLEISNSDTTAHNIHAVPTKNKEFNISQPIPNQKNEQKFDTPEVMVKFKCDIHPWMNAYIGVLSHPYWAVSKADGTFEIKNLPAGTYTVEAWHEKYGTQTQSVTVGDGEAKDVPFTFKAAA